jgi:hypothetical protein
MVRLKMGNLTLRSAAPPISTGAEYRRTNGDGGVAAVNGHQQLRDYEALDTSNESTGKLARSNYLYN